MYTYILHSSWVIAVYLVAVCIYKEYMFCSTDCKLVFMSVSGTQGWWTMYAFVNFCCHSAKKAQFIILHLTDIKLFHWHLEIKQYFGLILLKKADKRGMLKLNVWFRNAGQQQGEKLRNNPEESNWNLRRKFEQSRQIPLVNRDNRHTLREPKERKRSVGGSGCFLIWGRLIVRRHSSKRCISFQAALVRAVGQWVETKLEFALT